MLFLSLQGTFRTVLVLVAVWVVLRFIMRFAGASRNARGSFRQAPPDGREPGDVRIERPDRKGGRTNGPDVVDADYEEVN